MLNLHQHPGQPEFQANSAKCCAPSIVFLGLNGLRFVAAPAHATASVLALAAGEIEEDLFAAWLEDHVAALES